MSLLGGALGLVGGLIGKSGADSQNDAQLEMFRESRELPEWLKPYMVGDPGPLPEPVPINYNWLDAIAAAAQGGMPQNMPPMSMNNPLMTFQNVYTPVQGGPWGYGLGPGQLTTEVGIPGAPGPQFIAPGEGFQPGPTNVAPVAPAPVTESPALDPNMLDLAQQHQDVWSRMIGMGADAYSMPSSLESLRFAMNNPKIEDYRGLMGAIIHSAGGRGRLPSEV